MTEPGEGCVSNIFLVPKADNKWRLILNLKVLNMYTEHEHFKMEGIDCVRDLLTRREYMCKLDLRDAYLSVPINPSEVSEVSVEGHNISVQCPPIWAGHGPSGLHEDTQTSLGPPKSQGPENHSLLLLIGRNMKEAEEAYQTEKALLEELGFVVNSEKSVTSFPGDGIFGVRDRFTVRLPQAKVKAIKNSCRQMLRRQTQSIRQLSHLVGVLAATGLAVVPAPLHYWGLQALKIKITSRMRQG